MCLLSLGIIVNCGRISMTVIICNCGRFYRNFTFRNIAAWQLLAALGSSWQLLAAMFKKNVVIHIRLISSVFVQLWLLLGQNYLFF